MLKRAIYLLFSVLFISACASKHETSSSPFVKVENGQLIKNGQPSNYVGTNS